MITKQLIECNQDILSGIPVFVGTRVPVQNLLDYFEGGDTLDDFLDDFPTVTRIQAIALLNLFKEMLFVKTNGNIVR